MGRGGGRHYPRMRAYINAVGTASNPDPFEIISGARFFFLKDHQWRRAREKKRDISKTEKEKRYRTKSRPGRRDFSCPAIMLIEGYVFI